MPARLGSDDDPTVAVLIKMPASMKTFLDTRRGGASRYVRKLLAKKMASGRYVPPGASASSTSEEK